MITVMKGLRHWLGRTSASDGQTLVEYSLVIGLISLVILAAFQIFIGGANGLVTYIGEELTRLLGGGS